MRKSKVDSSPLVLGLSFTLAQSPVTVSFKVMSMLDFTVLGSVKGTVAIYAVCQRR